MWPQTYTPVADSLWASALAAALPVFVLLLLLGVLRKPAWMAGLAGLAAAAAVAAFGYGMPVAMAAGAALYGAAFGIMPIGWIVFAAILLYRITVETGKFEVIKNSIGQLSGNPHLQALLIAFAFGAFIEGAAGFGSPVAIAAAMLTGLGFSPFYAAAICLLANTAPVAFGSIGIPVVTLAGVTGLPKLELSAAVGRICGPVSLFIPAYMVMVMGGRKALRGVLPAAAACGVTFAGTQVLVSNFVGPELTDILSSLASLGVLVLLLARRKPREREPANAAQAKTRPYRPAELAMAWAPYGLLVMFVLLWGSEPVRALLDKATVVMPWPGLHNTVLRMPPVVKAAVPYPASYSFAWLSAAGTATFFAGLASAVLLRMSLRQFGAVAAKTARQLALPLVTIASVLALAFLMNYCGATATLGLALAETGALFPFFSAMLGWIGVFLTGSDTSANALFGNLQVVTANHLGVSPVLMSAANSAGGVMGKMISLQSIAVAAAAAGMARAEEAKLFRFTLRHSVFLACVIGLITAFYAWIGV